MFWVEPDNFVTCEYEFNTTEPYREIRERYILHDRDAYKDTLFSKLIICARCSIFISIYKLSYTETPITYLGYPGIHGCAMAWCFRYAPWRKTYYCVPYPPKLW